MLFLSVQRWGQMSTILKVFGFYFEPLHTIWYNEGFCTNCDTLVQFFYVLLYILLCESASFKSRVYIEQWMFSFFKLDDEYDKLMQPLLEYAAMLISHWIEVFFTRVNLRIFCWLKYSQIWLETWLLHFKTNMYGFVNLKQEKCQRTWEVHARCK